MTTKTPKIKFYLRQFGCSVVFAVLEMDERFRKDGKKNHLFQSSKGLSIRSTDAPDLFHHAIYLRGRDKSKDNESTTIQLDTPEEAAEYKAKVIAALEDWADNWEGWEDNQSEQVIDPYTYEF